MSFTTQQVEQLLHPIKINRVLSDGKGHSHVSQQDVLAHLIRVFGFGNFDTEVLSCELVFESERANAQGVSTGRFDVCYRAMVRLTVRGPDGVKVCSYENGSTATAQNQTRGDGHDLAYKSAISLSVKRAAIALGDQFGLSLYNKGQTDALVGGTFIGRAVPETKTDMQEGVPQQVSLGNDETDPDPEQQDRHLASVPAPAAGTDWLVLAAQTDNIDALRALYKQAAAAGVSQAVKAAINARGQAITQGGASA
jgi:hypothetical protein